MDYGIPLLPQYVVWDEAPPDLFALKKALLKQRMTLLEEQLHRQRDNLESNLLAIEEDLCQCTTASYRLPYGAIHAYNQIHLQHRLPLYQERRKHRNEYQWLTAKLRKELLDTQLEFQSLEDKLKLLE